MAGVAAILLEGAGEGLGLRVGTVPPLGARRATTRWNSNSTSVPLSSPVISSGDRLPLALINRSPGLNCLSGFPTWSLFHPSTTEPACKFSITRTLEARKPLFSHSKPQSRSTPDRLKTTVTTMMPVGDSSLLEVELSAGNKFEAISATAVANDVTYASGAESRRESLCPDASRLKEFISASPKSVKSPSDGTHDFGEFDGCSGREDDRLAVPGGLRPGAGL
mmetsp:Transcript_122164/g.317443  ORF Transcript_122164/g.317443 Transcript_122164/m.317443 type:complete len:222 (+) Transcript_122164:1783-2448(+)